MLKTEAGMKNTSLLLKQILYIYSPLRFQKNFAGIKVLIDSSSEISAMVPAYISKLEFRARTLILGLKKLLFLFFRHTKWSWLVFKKKISLEGFNFF